jgi:hypothetical protein
MKKEEKASALIIALLVIFLIAASIAVAMQLTTATVRQTDSSRDFSALRGATEGALDFAYGTWTKTINNYYRPVSKAELTPSMATVPSFSGFSPASWPLQITPVNRYGEPSDVAVYTLLNLDNYPGWTGKNYGYVASARLTGTFAGGRPVTYGAKRAINYSVVPLFQATAFFEDNLELYKTAPMTIGGLVHTNSHAYVSSSSPVSGGSPSLAFSGNLSYVGGYTDDQAPPQADTWSGYTPNSAFSPAYSGAGADDQVNQVTRMEPLGADAATLLHPPSTGDTNPNDDSIRELIEPRDPNTAYPDPTPIAQRRLINKAGIIIRVTATTTTITTQNGTTLTAAQKTALTNAISRQTIYDRREGKDIDLTSLNVSQARTTLNAASGFNNILYIYDDTSTGYSDPKGIRLTNGGTLPTGGFTLATQNPLYIQGDYNTSANRVSSAVFADAVTILSNNWSDNQSNAALAARQATSTTVNTAIVAGFLPSGWTNPVSGAQYGYSGGLNNFPRFLETWSNDTFTYTGSMIELFTSKIATGEWDTGSIYSPPTRVWNFDSNFVDNPPPGSLDAVSIGRGSLARF